MVGIFDISGSKVANKLNLSCFCDKTHLLPLTFNVDGGSERPEFVGTKMALLLFLACLNLEMGVFNQVLAGKSQGIGTLHG
jgi:hypothetical protein